MRGEREREGCSNEKEGSKMKKLLPLVVTLILLVSGCTTIGTPILKRIYDPITMVPGEYPY